MSSRLDLQIFDSRKVWFAPALKAARARGWKARRITGAPKEPSRFGFIRPHPAKMPQHIALDTAMRAQCGVMVQDRRQVVLYEDKAAQTVALSGMLPETKLYTDKQAALAYSGRFPVVSKAKEGASSVNVRIIKDLREYQQHVAAAFSPDGIPVNRCADQTYTVQKGYIILQRFIPHTVTYRVNIIGGRAAIFERYNYPDRPVAQTGNATGVKRLSDLHADLLQYAFDVARGIGSKWVALDILDDAGTWRLLETSLAWPWSEKEYSDVPFFSEADGSEQGTWGGMWDVLYDQLEAGVFGSTSA